MIQKIWCVTAFCLLTAELSYVWGGFWVTPWHFTTDFLMAPVPGIRMPVMDFIILGLLFAGRAQAGAMLGRAKPVETAIWVTVATLMLWAIYGAFKGGSVVNMRLQLHICVMVMLSAVMQIYVFRTREHYRMLGKAILYAGIARALLIFVFYVTTLRYLKEPMETITDHADTLLFVTCIAIVVANAIHSRSRNATRNAVLVTALMLFAIQLNGRRLAYVSLVGVVIIIFALMWNPAMRRKTTRYLLSYGWIVALYVGIGWGHPTGIFKPIASLQSVNDANNPSTQSRIMENLGLIVTLQTSPLVGTGFGHKYIEVSTVYSVGDKIFPEYRYVPHNSLLGLLAFTGGLGFVGIWTAFYVTGYFAARSYAFAKVPIDKTIAMVSLCEILIHTNQMWGDIGNGAFQGVALMSTAIAASSRISVLSGAWPAKLPAKKKARARQPSIPAAGERVVT